MKRTWNLLLLPLVVLWATWNVRAANPVGINLDSPQWSAAIDSASITNNGIEIVGVPKVGSITLLKNVRVISRVFCFEGS